MPQTFRHPTGWTFQYPDGWSIAPNQAGSPMLVPPQAAPDQEVYPFNLTPVLNVDRPDSPHILQAFSQELGQLVPALAASTPRVQPVRFGPQPGVQLTWESGPLSAIFLIVLVGNQILSLGAIGAKPRVAARLPALAGIAATSAFGDPLLDPQLVGAWSNTEHYSSGSFSGSAQTVMRLNPDGTCSQGGGRVMASLGVTDDQGDWLGAVAGDTGPGREGQCGHWCAGHGVLYVRTNEVPCWVPSARYCVEGPPGQRKMLLTTGDGKRELWYEAV
jgi:hypothetical protein